MSIVGMSGIIGKAEVDFATTEATGDSELDKEDFLTLLVTQLEYQDPLNPTDDTEFTAQLAQFSSLEQLTNISETLDGMAETDTQESLLNASSYIGKYVVAEGSSVTKNEDEISTIYFDVDEAIAVGYVNVYDANSNLIRSEVMGSKAAGSYSYTWDGLNSEGDAVEDGVYYVAMAAQDADGQAVLIYTDVSGEVTGVQSYDDTTYLILADGRAVEYSAVTRVVVPTDATGDTDTTNTTGTTDTTETTDTTDTTDSTDETTTGS
ncbi:MAG: flagellar hook assembly protein FlgD [Desulfovibrionaceae bacterium]